MSLRGPRGGRVRIRGSGRGRGTGRGRGRGGRTVLWTWESYTPGPEVYDQLYHIRREPVIVTECLDANCPIPGARTRIRDRRQTEGDIQRNFYVVDIVYDNAKRDIETEHVDLSAILDYVSPDELERFENEQFQIEAEAEAVALRAELEERGRKRLEKNARLPGNKGTSHEAGFHGEQRVRGRPRGRGRGRGRGNWRGRAMLGHMAGRDSLQDQVKEDEPQNIRLPEEGEVHREIAETDSEDDELQHGSQLSTSPGVARSAFVANSALPVSPVAVTRRFSNLHLPTHEQFDTEIEESDIDLVGVETGSISSAAKQLQLEEDRELMMDESSDVEGSDDGGHRSKRRRTGSTTSEHLPKHRASPQFLGAVIPSSTADEMSQNSSQPIPDWPTSNGHHRLSLGKGSVDGGTFHVAPSTTVTMAEAPDHSDDDEDDNVHSDTEEYVVEGILEHYYDDDGKKYYLVKWAGYEDSHDWLSKEDLEGAAEVVAEYNARIRRKKGKMKAT